MRGLTKEEATALAATMAAEDMPPQLRPFADDCDIPILDDLIEAGRIGPLAPDGVGYVRSPLTPLGKLALRVHQLCVERGLA